MSKRILALILCMVLVITSCTKKENGEVNQPVDVEKEYDEDKFELTALKSDKQGIDNSSGFQLISKDKMRKSHVERNLHIVPEEEFKIEEISDTVFNILPLNSLDNDKIYQVMLNDELYEYSWAFQTKKEFKIESTLPGDGNNYVPVHSGIEMYFSLGSLKEMDEYFEIVPKVEGSFIQNDSSVIFVPQSLEYNTRYTVTIKKGFGLADGSQELKEDHAFSFITKTDDLAKIYFETPLINIAESNVKAIGANINNQYNDSEFAINIYQYKEADKFAEDIKKYADTGKFPDDIQNDGRMSNIRTINQKPFVDTKYSYNSKALFELPKELEKGCYLLEFSTEGADSKVFMQINDMMMYNTIFGEQILVYALDSVTSKGIKNANVFLNGEKLGSTDENGALTANKRAEDYKTVFMKLEADGYNDFVYADSELFKYHYYRDMNYAAEYFRYLDTDRPVYLPTDTVNVWGFARRRHDGAVNKVRIDLVETYTGMTINSKEVELTDIGTYETQFELKNATSGGLRINVYDNDFEVFSKYVEVRKYSKPLYTFSGDPSKKIMYSGDDLKYKINAGFFDGNPVPDLKVKVNAYAYGGYGFIDYGNTEQEAVLNEKGEKNVDISTVVNSVSWRPVTVYINSFNNEAEDMSVNLYDSVTVFPKDKMIEMVRNADNPTTVDIRFHELVIRDYNSNYFDYDDLRGNPLDADFNVVITEIYYEKEKIGESYDFINKVNRVVYDYKRVENIVYNESVSIAGGMGNVQIPDYDKDRSYKITASYYEANGGTIQEEVTVDGRFRPYNRMSYSLENNDNKEDYRLNENISMELVYDNNTISNSDNDSLILMFARNGLVDYMSFDSTNIQFPFKEEYISAVSIQGIYVVNGYMYPVSSHASYDVTERQMYFDVATDKEDYSPGEEVTLNIRAFDENNNPCVADINVSVVDEAYFAVFEKDVNTLFDLYFGRYRFATWNPGVIKSYLSNVDPYTDGPGMPEMGGGGGNDNVFRDDFDDTAAFETVTTGKDGKATIKFKLPDNLTSWRITYQGISDKLYAGSGQKNITAGLPFFVDLIMGDEYLKDDNISISLRTFGTAAVAGEEVDYSISVVNKETGKKADLKQKGVIGDYTNILLGKQDEGSYEIYVTAASKNNKDAIKEEFSVVESYVYFNNTSYYKLTEQTVLDEVYSNAVITLFNESSSDFYNSLDSIYSGGGNRIDQTVSSMLAAKYVNDNFDADLDFSQDELLAKLSEYEAAESYRYMGYKLLPYAEVDMEITVKLANLIDDEYLNAKFKRYFDEVLIENTDYSIDISAALWGLSNYREPVLLKIYDLLDNNQELGTRDKIYLALALTELGDKKTANKCYREFISTATQSGDYLYYDNKQNDTDNYEITALLSVLGSKLKNYDTGDRLFRYVYKNPSKMTLSNFEQLIYIMSRDIMKLDEIKDLFGEVTVTADGTKKAYELKLFDRESLAISKDKIKDVKFSGINGSIACKVDALGSKNDLDKNKSDEMSLGISYKLANTTSEQNKYKQSELVAVSITPGFAPVVEHGVYEITYVIPSGFRYVRTGTEEFWASEDGQKLTFYYSYDRRYPVKTVVFHMQSAQKGEYTVDYVVIKENMEAKLNYVDKRVLTIE